MTPVLMHDFEKFRISVKEVTADVVEIARDLESKVESEDVTELLQSHFKTFNGWGVLLIDQQKLRWHSRNRVWEDWLQFCKKLCGLNAIKHLCMLQRTCLQKRPLMFPWWLRNYHSYLKPSAATTLISQQPSTSRQDLLPAKRLQLPEGSDDDG